MLVSGSGSRILTEFIILSRFPTACLAGYVGNYFFRFPGKRTRNVTMSK